MTSRVVASSRVARHEVATDTGRLGTMAISVVVREPAALRAIARPPAATGRGERIGPAGEILRDARTGPVPAAKTPTPTPAVTGTLSAGPSAVARGDRIVGPTGTPATVLVLATVNSSDALPAVDTTADPTAVRAAAMVAATIVVRSAGTVVATIVVRRAAMAGVTIAVRRVATVVVRIAVREPATVARIAEAMAAPEVATVARTTMVRAVDTSVEVTGARAETAIAPARDVPAMSGSPASGSHAVPETELVRGARAVLQGKDARIVVRDTGARTTGEPMGSGRNVLGPIGTTTDGSTVPRATVRARVPGRPHRIGSSAQAPNAAAHEAARGLSGRTRRGAPTATISCGRATDVQRAETRTPAISLAGMTRTRGSRGSSSPCARDTTTRSSPRMCRHETCRVRRGSS